MRILSALVIVGGAAVVALVHRGRRLAAARRAGDAELDAIIREKGLRTRFEGYDPELRERTEQKRRSAERARGHAARVETRPTRGDASTAVSPFRRQA